MPIWLTAAIAGVGKLLGAAGDLMEAWHTSNLQKQAMTAQRTTDDLQGKTDALHQVDTVAAATDAGDGGVLNDPLNRPPS